MDDDSESGISKYETGEYRAAAAKWAIRSFRRLTRENYDLGTWKTREGLSMMLGAIEADVRAGNHSRAEIHLEMSGPLYRRLATESEKPVLQGLGWEWLGDAHLLVGTAEPATYYRKAEPRFEDLTLNDHLFWGAAPEYDYAYAAMDRFFKRKGYEYPTNHDFDFHGRVQWKRETLEALDRGSDSDGRDDSEG